MKNELQKLFVYFISIIVLLLIGYIAFGPQGKTINLKEINFTTNNSSKLYFKNIRSYFYEKEVRDDALFELYRIKSRNNILSFVIINNWLLDESYILRESKYKNISINWQFKEEQGNIEIGGENNHAHYTFAAELFEQLDRKSNLWLLTDVTKIEFTEEEKTSLKTTLKDYFKLVGKLR